MSGQKMRRQCVLSAGAVLALAIGPSAFAQTPASSSAAQGAASAPDVFFARVAQPPDGGAVSVKSVRRDGTPVQGAPYSATITNESVQTLADGNRIVVKTTGFVARDSVGRTRQQMELPALGNLSAANLPQIVFIQDPVAGSGYALNLTDKTAHAVAASPAMLDQSATAGVGAGGPGTAIFITRGAIAGGAPPPAPPKDAFFIQKATALADPSQTATQDLGSQVFDGVPATGTRTTLTIPAGEIGNEQPIEVVTEVWTSADLKAIVYSKRSDPRIGVQTFQLTNILRDEPDPAMFVVPSDFTTINDPKPVVYSTRP
jgi:hypothetical protein